jgi:cleavage stimulation factor subunit 3
MENELGEVARLEKIFQDHLMDVPDVQLWAMYLDHVRRTQNLTTDTTGVARRTITQAYTIVLDTLGHDKDSGSIWRDYIQFLQSAPGAIGGTSWEDGQKMDSLRKAYRQAVVIPTKELQSLWRDYHTFEHSLSQLTARKFLNEQSAAFMDAKQAWVQLQNITERLNRSGVPRLPPASGFEGDAEHQEQIEIWKRWIAWEKNDPLSLKKDEPKVFEKRILQVYKQASMWMRFEPEFWNDAAEFCFKFGLSDQGDDFLKKGIAANPESCLLAFRQADRLEMAPSDVGAQDAAVKRGHTVRAPYDKLLTALYDLIDVTKSRNEKTIARIQENHSRRLADLELGIIDNEEEHERSRKALESEQEVQIKAVQSAGTLQEDLLKRTISYSWIALMRAMRRIQGKGKPADTNSPGMRGIFTEARKRGRLVSDFYAATAWMEHHCYKEPAAGKIFHRGSNLFPDDERFALEHIKYLISVQDATSKYLTTFERKLISIDARVTFATIVQRLTQKPENIRRTKKLYLYFHEYESKYGELNQVVNLEKKMLELFPEDAHISYFAHRFEQGDPNDTFDPTTVRPIISVVAQMRPKLPHAAVAMTPSLSNDFVVNYSPRPSASPRPVLPIIDNLARNSPKRPFLADSSDESHHPRKIARGESPLKGAAGRRLDAARRRNEGSAQHAQLAPAPLPADVNFLLLALPRTELCANIARMNVPALMSVIGSTKLDGIAPSKLAGFGYAQR